MKRTICSLACLMAFAFALCLGQHPGLIRPDGSIRLPHPYSEMNPLGKAAQESYGSLRPRGGFAE
jgi:hypothetical protein